MPMKIREIDGHSVITRNYGDGYQEPHEEAIDCECGAHIWSWMQFYFEAPDWEQDWIDHLAFVQSGIDPAPIYQDLADDYESAYAQLNQELTHFSRIDCSIPRWRKGGLF